MGQLQAFQYSHHGVLEGEEKDKETGNLFKKIMKEKFPNLVKNIDTEVREAQRVPNKMDAKRPTPTHIIIKMPKVKDKEMGEGVGEWGKK